MQDALGKPVYGHLERIFEGRQSILRLVDRIDDLRQRLAHMRGVEWAQDVPIVECMRRLQAVRSMLLTAAPYTTCPCLGKGCKWCRGEGWLSLRRCREVSSRKTLSALSESFSTSQPSQTSGDAK